MKCSFCVLIKLIKPDFIFFSFIVDFAVLVLSHYGLGVTKFARAFLIVLLKMSAIGNHDEACKKRCTEFIFLHLHVFDPLVVVMF